ncbi:MAG: molybdopterin converting factor subunit 1 [Nibricoccus sp.]
MRILFFSDVRNEVGQASIELPLDETDVSGLWKALIEIHPALARFRSRVRIAQNSEFVDNNARFRRGDEIALIPPVSGG